MAPERARSQDGLAPPFAIKRNAWAPHSVLRRADGTALLYLIVLSNTFCIGAFAPLLPEIARAQLLADVEIGILAGAFGFARTVGSIPAGLLVTHRRGTVLVLAALILLAGTLLLGSAGPFVLLVLGRLLTGLAHTLGMIVGLTAILQDERSASASLRLNGFEFAGMLGVLGGLATVGVLPQHWRWNMSYLLACAPQLVVLGLLPLIRRRFPDPRPGLLGAGTHRAGDESTSSERANATVWMMFGVGTIIALAWSSVSQFVIPLRGTREFGLDRAGVSWMLAIAQLVDLVVLLPVGRIADRVGRLPVLGGVALALGVGTLGVGVGSFPWFVTGCALFGLGLAGWMLPLGVIREHTRIARLAWRTGVYRVGVDGAIFLGPVLSGLLGEMRAGVFVAVVGAVSIGVGLRLIWRGLH